ncbi:hypothetical protein [Merismopedia glauca]|uniref:Uncharacterized protein n=1 Tax=Merismopedia glauca CCAP 1448/3 TaxID=1296344 RepID=A0A2T1BWS4_9CYAN|nr:hypothetical protein [Merismopedia glauca]PSB00465.1 hypothetical protein C7B64_23375 [Merismopedia glauca CCAP 1448/3]
MKFFSIASLTLFSATAIFTCSQVIAETGNKASNSAVIEALSSEVGKSSQAIARLRTEGMAGVDRFWQAYQEKWQGKSPSPQNLEWQRWRAAFDAVCQQRDCFNSRLYWYTDLDAAKKAAQATGKPILSLRLLGNLDEELSCANSRFFRTVLYPNAKISQELRDRYILHWQSVRPVPKVTIDFGDGRKLEQTVTGNSIHYVLDSNGQPIEALPGLHSPQAFLRFLERSQQLNQQYSQRPASEKTEFLAQYHRDRLSTIQSEWTADLSKLGVSLALPNLTTNSATNNGTPSARTAAPLAMTKMAVERPLLNSTNSDRQQTLETATNETIWSQIANLHLKESELDSSSQALMEMKKAPGVNLKDVLPNFQRLVALDTVRNEYLMHAKLHQWFVNQEDTANVEVLNQKVYAQLFLTPSSDPWLGLLPVNTYTGIENDGVRIPIN